MESLKKIISVWLMSAALLLISSNSHAALLGLQIAFPQIEYTTSSPDVGASYDAGAGVLTIKSTPVFLTMTAGGTSTFLGGTMSLTANIDNTGAISSGGTFSIQSGGNILIAGTVDNYGKSDATSLIDFALTANDGTLLADFLAVNSTGATAAVMSLLSSTFTDFNSDWTATDAKGDIGPIPTIPELPAHTIGYWKNHPEVWSFISLNICGNDMDQDELIGVLSTQVRGDKTISMAHQLIASSLNALAGSSCPTVDQLIDDSESWLCSHGGIGAGVKKWDGGEPLKNALDDFNNNGCI